MLILGRNHFLCVTEENTYVYTSAKHSNYFYDIDTMEYVGKLVEVNGAYKAILKKDNKISKFEYLN